MQKLYFCRHGETEWTISQRHTGTTDIPLTSKGVEQAQLLRKSLKDVSFEKVFSSPKSRALQTCEGMNPIVSDLLCEWDYGLYEGITTTDIQKKAPSWNLFKDGPLGGEPIELVAKRADTFLKQISQIPGNIAIFSHGHFLRILAARFLHLSPQMGMHFSLSVASISLLSYERNVPVIDLWNQTDFLEGISSKVVVDPTRA